MTASLEEQRAVENAPVEPRGSWFTALPTAVQFLTVMPPVIRRPFTARELGAAVGWFPAVGALLGGLLVLVNWLLAMAFPTTVTTALVLVVWVLATGALHLDGFLDSCDGMLGGRTPEARLRIMRDERVGAFAVVGGILLLLVKFTALASLTDRFAALLAAPVIGRYGVCLAVVGFPYGRPEGLGRTMKDHAGWPQVVLATVIAVGAVGILTAFLASGWRAAVALALSLPLTWAVGRVVLRRLPGLTGDIYGSLSELLEVVVLLVFVAGGDHA
jgi:adenosylcobinamide-GDP ribazoletransferase